VGPTDNTANNAVNVVACSLFGPRRKMMTAISQWNSARRGPFNTSLPDTALNHQVFAPRSN